MKGQPLMIFVTNVTNPPPTKAIANPITAYNKAFLAFVICPSLPAEVRKRILFFCPDFIEDP